MKIPASLQKLRDRCCRSSNRTNRRSMLGPKRSKSAPFYFQDSVESELHAVNTSLQTPPPNKAWFFTSSPNSSPVSTPGYSRRADKSGARNSPYRLSAPPTMPHSISEPTMKSAVYGVSPIKQTSLGVLAPRVKSQLKRQLSLTPLYEEKRSCSEECVMCSLVRDDLKGRHSNRVHFPPSRDFS